MEHITLYYQQGSSDKVYRASIQPAEGGFIVPFAYGRRGTTLQTGSKTQQPVPYAQAQQIFHRLVAEKEAKGYTPGADGTPYQQTGHEPRATGILPQLLNPIEANQLASLLASPEWWMQPKFDGKRLLLQKRGGEITGINRRGLQVALPKTLVDDAGQSPEDFLLDGEAIGDRLHVFDLLQAGDEDQRPKLYLERFLRLMRFLSVWECRHIALVPNTCTGAEKRALMDALQAEEAEGVVFKRIDQPYTAGRPASGGPALKHKFHETASLVVSKINGKRSVSLLLFDGEKVKPAGNVTIPANHDLPQVGQVVEVRYLYAFRESGCLYQPVYLGVRDDLTSEECTVDQLKYKAAVAREAA